MDRVSELRSAARLRAKICVPSRYRYHLSAAAAVIHLRTAHERLAAFFRNFAGALEIAIVAAFEQHGRLVSHSRTRRSSCGGVHFGLLSSPRAIEKPDVTSSAIKVQRRNDMHAPFLISRSRAATYMFRHRVEIFGHTGSAGLSASGRRRLHLVTLQERDRLDAARGPEHDREPDDQEHRTGHHQLAPRDLRRVGDPGGHASLILPSTLPCDQREQPRQDLDEQHRRRRPT